MAPQDRVDLDVDVGGDGVEEQQVQPLNVEALVHRQGEDRRRYEDSWLLRLDWTEL
jgi:hypothetical protein